MNEIRSPRSKTTPIAREHAEHVKSLRRLTKLESRKNGKPLAVASYAVNP
jgi:hypothetical protein